MAKFPSQNMMTYDVTAISDDSMSGLGHVNIPKDLSILNRRGYASTTRKGVPLVYRTRFTFQLGDDLGRRAYSTGDGTTAYPADMMATLKILGCQNNWVMKNAAVKLHAAREHWLSQTGVPKKNRGAYSHEIRYVYDAADDTWLAPIDGDGNALAGGTWDVTTFADDLDNSYKVKLVGSSVDETNTTALDEFSLPGLYLNSRANLHTDTNVEADDTPTRYSHLQFLLGNLSVDEQQDVAITNIRDEQDNPPYDPWEDGDTNNDITESVELGRAVVSLARPTASVTVDVPFGICDLRGAVDLDGSSTDEPVGLVQAKVLKIFEMQG